MSRARTVASKPQGHRQIVRHKHLGNYTTVPNTIVEDKRLSVAAKGLLCYLISRPKNWQVRHDHVARTLGIGRKLFVRCRDELIDAGYLVCDRQQGRDEHNRFTTLNYVVSDIAWIAPEPKPPRQPSLREMDTGNNKEEIKTESNNSLPNPLSRESRSNRSSTDQIRYSEFGQRALNAGNHPVFVGSKPYDSWLRLRGPDGMPGFVDCIEKAGRSHRVVWMPSLYPPKQSPNGFSEEDGQ